MGKLPEKKIKESKLELSSQGYVTLPFNGDQFKEFVAGLLGKPQSIDGIISGSFEINRDDIMNLFDLINQRVTQQNDATLILFTSRIIFSDNTSVQVNSIDALIAYNEIKPVVSESVHITFQYLIKFQDKNVPEKQEINVSFITSDDAAKDGIVEKEYDKILLSMFRKRLTRRKAGFIQYNIKHTARTWGADIDSLLSNQFRCLIQSESSIKSFLRKYDIILSLAVMVAIVTLGLVYSNIIEDIRLAKRAVEINEVFDNTPADLAKISRQLKFSLENPLVLSGTYSVYALLASFGIGLFAFVLSGNIINTPKNSYVLLSKESLKNQAIQEKKYNKQFLHFFLALIISILCSLIANYIFIFLEK